MNIGWREPGAPKACGHGFGRPRVVSQRIGRVDLDELLEHAMCEFLLRGVLSYCKAEGGTERKTDYEKPHRHAAARMSTMGEVRIVRCTGCSNSRCMPRPTNLVLSIVPPQVDPFTRTSDGPGQYSGWPEIRAVSAPRITIV